MSVWTHSGWVATELRRPRQEAGESGHGHQVTFPLCQEKSRNWTRAHAQSLPWKQLQNEAAQEIHNVYRSSVGE